MKDDKKKSIIKEAICDYNEIIEAADANAKKKLAEEYSVKYNELLKEEIENKNKSVKESYVKIDENKESKKLDESESNKESVMKNEKKETKKVVKENAGEGKPFDEKAKNVETVKEEREKDFTGDVEADTPNLGKGEAENGDTFTDKIKSKEKPISNISEDFDVTELDIDSVGSALDNADQNDEVLTMNEIEKEIEEMQGLDNELNSVESNSSSSMEESKDSDPFTKLVNMRNELDEMIKKMGVKEMHNGQAPLDKMHNGEYNSSLIDEKDTVTDDDIEAVLSTETNEKPVEEAHGLAYSSRRNMAGRNLPNAEYLSKGELDQAPYVQESKKKITGLINENKLLTKKLNESKKLKESVNNLIDGYKSALDKYRKQLKEMAVFNTNLSHVNNLLVNEELALTQDDKIKIINEFKKIDSITESKNKYKSFLTEMKESKKTLTESIEDKVSVSIQSSSKQKLDEVIEKTAYADDKHIQKMKRLIEYVEKRDKKNNLNS